MNKIISIGTLLVLSLLPSYLLRFDIFKIPTTVLEIMLLILIFLWIIQNRKRLRKIFVLRREWAIFIALVVVAATVSAIVSPNTFAALGIWKAYFIEPILFFYLLVDLLQQKQISFDKILVALCVGGLLVSLAALLQWSFNVGVPIPWDVERRVTGLFDYPNALGLYLGPLTVLMIGRLLYPCHCEQPSTFSQRCWGAKQSLGLLRRLIEPPRNDKTLLYFISVILFSTAVILAQSEAAIASVAITTVIMFLCDRKLRKPTLAVSVILLLIVFSIPTSREFLTNKILLQDYSGQVRLSQWSETIKLLKDRPILGAGLSGYQTALVSYHKDTQYEIFQYPHNIFLNIWVELGLLGLIAFGFLIYVILKNVMSLRGGQIANDALILFTLVQIFIHGLVDVPYFKNDLAILTWALLSIFYVSAISEKTEQR